MCGIFFTNKNVDTNSLDHAIEFLKKRGPDKTTTTNIKDFIFVHTLLSMTGPITTQPFYNDDKTIILIYNGEIYNFENFGKFNSDGECLIPLYEKYGDEFVKYLDGEFAIILIDLNKNKLLFSTDIFGTRPLWICFNDDKIGISSYKSCLDRIGFNGSFQVLANKTYVYELYTLKFINEINIHTFDLNQKKNTFDDWIKAFSESIKKRTKYAKCGIFMGLSAGYDSGAISCELTKQNINFKAYCISNGENLKIIEKRKKLIKDIEVFNLKNNDFEYARNHVKKNAEFYIPNIDDGEEDIFFRYSNNTLNINNYKILENAITNRKNRKELSDDNGSVGCSFICSQAIKNNYKIYLSGSGADEILSDYGFKKNKIYGHSSIGGFYPDDLNIVFPWKNFFGNTQRAYLMKEEYIAGSYGIEGRYPFLDKNLVQEFLWLNNNLKNNIYKAPIDHYLNLNQFPYEKDQKLGFSCGYRGITGENKVFNKLVDHEIIELTSRKININSYQINFDNYIKKTYEFYDIIDKSKIIHLKENLYYVNININHPGIKYNLNCPYVLLENNKIIGKSEYIHDNIAKIGNGLYCFWTSIELYFSSGDNSNPILNDKVYTIDML
jgi:asparagine synthetase B (glutamine-hydrolysing)